VGRKRWFQRPGFPFPSSVESTITSSPPAYNSVSNEAFPFPVHVTCLLSTLSPPPTYGYSSRADPGHWQLVFCEADCFVPECRNDAKALFSSLTVSHASCRLREAMQLCLGVWEPCPWAQGEHFH